MLFLLFFILAARNEREIVSPTPGRRIRGSPSRDRCIFPPINTAGRQTFAVNGLNQDPCYLLRQSSVLGCGPATKRFLQLIRNVRAYEHTFSVCHIRDSPF